MMSIIGSILLIIGCYLFLNSWLPLLFRRYTDTPFGFKGRLVYKDDGKASATFINKHFGISAKPDFIFLTEAGNYRLIEYKSRKGRVYESDIAQTIASVIAARSKYPISEAEVHTDTQTFKVKLHTDNKRLFEVISKHHALTVKIKRGIKVNECNPSQYKCRSCSMKKHCELNT